MTNLLTKDRLCEIARAATRPIKPPARPPATPPGRPVVAMRWTIDARTGRPIGRWVLGDEPSAEDFPPDPRS